MLKFVHSSLKLNHRFLYLIESGILVLFYWWSFRHVEGSAERVSVTILLPFLVYLSEVKTS